MRTHADTVRYMRQIRADADVGGGGGRFTHQEVVKQYLAEDRTNRGLVVVHELGTGKTITSIRVSESNPGRRVLVFTKAALSGRRQFERAVAVARDRGSSDAEVIAAYGEQTGYVADLLKEADDGTWVGHADFELADVATTAATTTTTTTTTMTADRLRRRLVAVDARYRFMHYNGGTSMLRRLFGPESLGARSPETHLAEVLAGRLPNPLDDHVVVVDEAHNVVESALNAAAATGPGATATTSGPPGAGHRAPGNGVVLYTLLTRARGVRAVLLTATPVVNRNYSVALLCNMAGGRERVAHVRAVHPDRVPVLLLPASPACPPCAHDRFLVPRDLTVAQFAYVVRKRIKLQREQALFLHVDGRLAPGTDSLGTLDARHRGEDGFLAITYALENTFG